MGVPICVVDRCLYLSVDCVYLAALSAGDVTEILVCFCLFTFTRQNKFLSSSQKRRDNSSIRDI